MTSRYIIELRTSRAVDELARHGVTEDEVVEVLLEAPRFFRDKVRDRTLMIGETYGGRLLTVVIEPVDEFGIWSTVTAWDASRGERSRWRKER